MTPWLRSSGPRQIPPTPAPTSGGRSTCCTRRWAPASLITEQERVRFRRDEELWLDIDHFRGLLAACQGHGHPPQEVCPDCLPLLAAAAVLYRDDFLAGFTLPDSPDFDRWQWLEGEQLRGELASALARLVAGHTMLGEFAHASPTPAAGSRSTRWTSRRTAG